MKMSACEDYIDLIMRSIDGQTDGQEETKLQMHLASCPGCKALYDEYLCVDEAVRNTEEEPPKQLSAAVMNRIHGEKARSGPGAWLKRGRFTAIAAVAAILVLVYARFGGGYGGSSAASSAAEPEQTVQTEAAAAQETTVTPQTEFRSGSASQATAAPEETEGDTAENAQDAENAENPANAEQTEPDTGLGTAEAGQVQAAPEKTTLQQALQDAGCQSETITVGLTGEELLALLPDASEVALDNGQTAYVASKETVDSLIASGKLSVSGRYMQIGQENSSDYWVVPENEP